MGLKLFGPTYDLLSRVLDLRLKRHTLTVSNIANADTPRYRAAHIDFEGELKKMMPEDNALQMRTTRQEHIPQKADFKTIAGTISESASPQRPDGNTVDMDKEVVRMSKNQLMYNTISQIMAKKLEGLYNKIREVK
jgi:flagellar basal-body rod protein FlgB